MKQIVTTPQLGFFEALNASTSKIFRFTGRSRRSEYWWTMLLVFLVSIVLTPFAGFVVDLFTIPLTFRRLHDTGRSGWWYGICFMLKFLFVICLISDVAMLVVHPYNLIGYEAETALTLVLKYLIYIGIISVYQVILVVFMCLDSEQKENKYGESPKYKIVDDDN